MSSEPSTEPLAIGSAGTKSVQQTVGRIRLRLWRGEKREGFRGGALVHAAPARIAAGPARIAAALAAYATLRLMFSAVAGPSTDLRTYCEWALGAVEHGLTSVYLTTSIDYPPLYIYPLYLLATAYQTIVQATGAPHPQLLTVLFHLPPLLFDLGIAALLFVCGREVDRKRVKAGLGVADAAWRRWSLLLPALYLLNPAVLCDSAYWGQTDAIHSFFVLGAFLALGAARFAPSRSRFLRGTVVAWVLLALGAMMKPLALPYVLPLLALSLAWHGARRTGLGIVAALLIALFVSMPFVPLSTPGVFLWRLVNDMGAMSFTSCNAHNLWWVLGSWRDSEAPWIGPITPTMVGITLYLLLCLALYVKGSRLHAMQREGITRAQGIALAATAGFGFFMVCTRLHENHLFSVLPLMLVTLGAVAARGGRPSRRALEVIFAGTSIALLLNMVTHDPWFSAHGPLAAGRLTGMKDPFQNLPVTYVRLWAMRCATFVTFLAFGATFVWVLSPGSTSLLASLAPSARQPGGEALQGAIKAHYPDSR